MIGAIVGVVGFIVVICPMIWFTFHHGRMYGDEVEGGPGGTHDLMAPPRHDGERR